MSLDSLKKDADLFFVKGLDLGLLDSGELAGFSRVKGYISVLQSLLQRLVEDAMDILDSF